MIKDMVGQKFGLLTVVSRADDEINKKGGRIIKWRCVCECGAEVVTRGSSLRSGHTKGCGQKHRQVEDLTGKRFSKLVVTSRAENTVNKNGTQNVMWECLCDCGKTTITRATSLKNGHTKSCGCFRNESLMGIGLIDLSGKVFGRWTVLYENGRLREPRGRLVPLWKCRCECGVERDIRSGTLVSGSSLSCGCYKHAKLSALAKQGFGLSKAESIVQEYLKDNNVEFEAQKIYGELRGASGYLLSYDFLIYKNGVPCCLIECQGKQHYEPVGYFGGEKQFRVQQDNDKRKRMHAKALDIPLFEIPYTYDTKETIIQLLRSYIIAYI